VAQSLAMLVIASWLNAAQDDSPVDSDHEASLARMRSVVASAILESPTGDSTPATYALLERPILRYTNPATSGVGEGATFLWLDGKRPVAAASPSIREGGMWWELSSLTDDALTLKRDNRTLWAPKSCSFASTPFPTSEAPSGTEAGRLIQMRNLARQVQVRENRRNQWQDGRLLTQPLYRWADADRRIVDGAVFGFAESTDPELLLILEARKDEATDRAAWRFALAKMTSSAVTVSIGEKEIWSAGNFWKEPRQPGESYIESKVAEPDQPPVPQSTLNSK
jgi:hypothetical protein